MTFVRKPEEAGGRPAQRVRPAHLLVPILPAVVGLLALLAGVPVRDSRPRGPLLTPPEMAQPMLPVPWPDPELAGARAPLTALDGRPDERPATAAPAGTLDPLTLKKIAKLQAKTAKKEAKQTLLQAKLATLQADLAAAQAALLAALQLPEASLEELALKAAAVKKATKAVNKKLKKIQATLDKLASLDEALAELLEQIEELESGDDGTEPGGDDPGGDDPAPTVTISVPLLVQEVLPTGATPLARADAEASFGIPFAEGAVPVFQGRPALAVANSAGYQFRTLDTWTDGSVRWALVDTLADVPAGGIDSSLEIVGGTGKSDGPDLASEDGNVITLDSGVMQATVLKSGFNLFDTVVVDGTNVVAPHQSAGIVGLDVDGFLVVPRADSLSVGLEENGPARAVVRVDGTLATLAGDDLLDFTCRITARALSADVQVDFTVRNASIQRPQHALLESLALVVRAQPGSGPVARLAHHLGHHQAALPAGSHAFLRQAYSSAPTTDVAGTGTNYKPHLPKSGADFVEQGYEISVDDVDVWSMGNKDIYPAHGWVDLSGGSAGITLSQRQMPYFWPSCLEVWGTGDVVAGLWSSRNPSPYVFCWRQHESRTVSFSFHKGPAVTPSQASLRLDQPVAGRAADYDQYDSAGVLPYRLLTQAEQNQAYALMGLQHTVNIHNDTLSVTRFLASHNTGGGNNHDSIERRLGGEWLRHGLGGQYLNGLDLALYKSEWQILRSDDFDDAADPGASNDASVPHSAAYDGDLEHRYRDGMALAYWLSGDERIKDALYDEEEILAHITTTAQERSLYQTLRALAVVGRFTGSERLRTQVHTKLDYVLTPTIDVSSGSSGFGWQSTPGSGSRRYFVNSSQNTDEKPVGENYVTRGFITASLGPLGYWHAASWLGDADPDAQAAMSRLTDLAWYTRNELFPYFASPADRHMVYAWAVATQQVVQWESSDFHPILLGMAEAFLRTGDSGYLSKGIEQIQAFKAHDQGPYSNNMYLLDSRLDVQHFLSVYLDSMTGP